jgi:hypothetical protein
MPERDSITEQSQGHILVKAIASCAHATRCRHVGANCVFGAPSLSFIYPFLIMTKDAVSGGVR